MRIGVYSTINSHYAVHIIRGTLGIISTNVKAWHCCRKGEGSEGKTSRPLCFYFWPNVKGYVAGLFLCVHCLVYSWLPFLSIVGRHPTTFFVNQCCWLAITDYFSTNESQHLENNLNMIQNKPHSAEVSGRLDFSAAWCGISRIPGSWVPVSQECAT